MSEERGDYLRREMDRRMLDAVMNSTAIKEDLANVRTELRDLRQDLKQEIENIAHHYQDKFEVIHKEEIKNSAARGRLQIYVLIIAFILMQWATHVFDKMFT
jgi:hypothetical protein